MTDARTYGPELPSLIAEGATIRVLEGHGLDGLRLELRPVPDDPRENVMDPRVLDMARARLSGAVATPAPDDLFAQRTRAPKESYAIDGESVGVTAALMDLGDRRIPVHVITPNDLKAPAPALLYYHGGGFYVGQFAQYENSLRLLSSLAGCVVVYPEYRMAPENPYPAPLDDCNAAVDWVCDHAPELGVDPSRIAVFGDSAGGSLACGVAQLQAGRGRIGLVVAAYTFADPLPHHEEWSYDLYPVVEEQRREAVSRIDRFKAPERVVGDMYVLGDDDKLLDPLISPALCEDFSAWPRTLVVSADYDYIRYQDELFAKRLQDAGADVRAVRYAGCDHGFFELCGVLPQVEDVCRLVADEIGQM